MNPPATIRPETAADTLAIRHVLEHAFGRPGEADVVEALRRSCALTLSLVAIVNETVVGHIAFSPVSFESPRSTSPALGLGPLAVLPDQGRRGIGSELARRGLDWCRRNGHGVVVVLGSPKYYSRFGFVAGAPHGITNTFGAPAEDFMVAELVRGCLACTGLARYRPEFDTVS